METMVRENRQKADVFSNLNDNQIILTNLPVPCPSMSKEADVKKFLLDKVHRDLDVSDIQLINAVQLGGEEERLAYIKVTLGSKRQA